MRIPLLPTIAIISIGLLSLSAGPSAAKTCKSHSVTGQALGKNPSQPQTLVLARLNWAVRVDAAYGAAWRNYNIASNKHEQCDLVGPVGRPFCTAEAIPCRP